MPVISWFQLAIGAIAAFGLSWLLHMVDVQRIESKHKQEIAVQKVMLEARCEADKALTKGANDDLQKELANINRKLVVAKRMQPSRCIIPASPSQTVMADDGREHAGKNGISSSWLREYAAECEQIRQTGLSCVKFVDSVWESRNH